MDREETPAKKSRLGTDDRDQPANSKVKVTGIKKGKAKKVTAAGNTYIGTGPSVILDKNDEDVEVIGQDGGETEDVFAASNLHIKPDNTIQPGNSKLKEKVNTMDREETPAKNSRLGTDDRDQPANNKMSVKVTGIKKGKAKKVTAAGNTYIGTGPSVILDKNGGDVEVIGQDGGETEDVFAASNLHIKPDNTIQPGNIQPQRIVERYRMEADPRGLCYIFNNKRFDDGSRRLGADRDRDNLKTVFEKLKFKVVPFDDRNSDQMKEEVEKLSQVDHDKYDCVVVIFLSHGKEGAVKGTDKMPLTIDKITSYFKRGACPSLEGKPKVFFFQSCRGDLYQKEGNVASDGNEAAVGGQEVETVNAPDTDFYIGYSTLSGNFSNRNDEHGSWYIQELVNVFDARAHEDDLSKLMTEVKGRVGKHRAELQDGTYISQSAECRSSLTKNLFF